jgi:N utilization substance protein B
MEEKIAELILQYLYSASLGGQPLEDLVPVMMRALSISKKTAFLGKEKAEVIVGLLPKLDEKIETISTGYDPERISEVERNVLRLALYSILYEKIDPTKVIHDSIRLVSKFSSPDSGAYVHAIISEVMQLEESSV